MLTFLPIITSNSTFFLRLTFGLLPQTVVMSSEHVVMPMVRYVTRLAELILPHFEDRRVGLNDVDGSLECSRQCPYLQKFKNIKVEVSYGFQIQHSLIQFSPILLHQKRSPHLDIPTPNRCLNQIYAIRLKLF